MRGKRYSVNHRYRGRSKSSAVLKVLVAVLAVLAFLLAAGVLFILFLGKYIEYTDNGVRLRLPWLEEEQSQGQPSAVISDLIIDEEPSTSSTPAPDRTLLQLKAVEVPVSAVTDGTAAGLVEADGGNALVVTVKDVEGYLAWQSASELAQSARGGSGEPLNGEEDFSLAVQALAEQGELYLIARVNCFQDLWMCVYDRSMALTTSGGGLWYDSNGMPWLSPASAAAREYLTGLCLELAEMGFDEILLDCAGFPGSGRQSAIATGDNYPAAGLSAAVSAWLEELDEALDSSGVWLSVQADRGALTGESSTGLTAAGLAESADRVWLAGTTDVSACAGALTEAGMDEAERYLVLIAPLSDETGEEWTGSRAGLLD